MLPYGFRRTESINVAAAFVACAVRCQPLSLLDEPSGKRSTTFDLIGLGQLPATPVPDEDPQHVRARFNLHRGTPGEAWTIDPAAVKQSLESGALEEADPCHPTLDVLRILEARECLLTFMERGTRYRIEVHSTAPRSRLVPGHEPLIDRMRSPGFETWHTESLVMAACMARIGVPVLNISGLHPHRVFVLPRFGHPLPGRPGPEDAIALVEAWESGELRRQCPESPIVWGHAGCKARRILRRAIETKGPCAQVFLHFNKTPSWQKDRRSAVIEERAPIGVEEQAIQHLRA